VAVNFDPNKTNLENARNQDLQVTKMSRSSIVPEHVTTLFDKGAVSMEIGRLRSDDGIVQGNTSLHLKPHSYAELACFHTQPEGRESEVSCVQDHGRIDARDSRKFRCFPQRPS